MSVRVTVTLSDEVGARLALAATNADRSMAWVVNHELDRSLPVLGRPVLGREPHPAAAVSVLPSDAPAPAPELFGSGDGASPGRGLAGTGVASRPTINEPSAFKPDPKPVPKKK